MNSDPAAQRAAAIQKVMDDVIGEEDSFARIDFEVLYDTAYRAGLARASGEWTTKKPTRAGVYWWHDGSGRSPLIVHVSEDRGGFLDHKGFEYGGYWAGPIEPPAAELDRLAQQEGAHER